jgi:hypothetical protein
MASLAATGLRLRDCTIELYTSLAEARSTRDSRCRVGRGPWCFFSRACGLGTVGVVTSFDELSGGGSFICC